MVRREKKNTKNRVLPKFAPLVARTSLGPISASALVKPGTPSIEPHEVSHVALGVQWQNALLVVADSELDRCQSGPIDGPAVVKINSATQNDLLFFSFISFKNKSTIIMSFMAYFIKMELKIILNILNEYQVTKTH